MVEREYSDETARAVRWTLDRLVDRFVPSPEHDALALVHRPHVRWILQLTADTCYNYQLERPHEWSVKGLSEVLGHVIPHKVMASKRFFAAVHPTLTRFLDWGEREGIWCGRDLAEVRGHIDESCRRLARKMKLPLPRTAGTAPARRTTKRPVRGSSPGT